MGPFMDKERVDLPLNEIPASWYNVLADLPKPLPFLFLSPWLNFQMDNPMDRVPHPGMPVCKPGTNDPLTWRESSPPPPSTHSSIEG